jgi:cell division protein FtsB
MQNINLYQERFRPRREIVQSRQLLLGLVALLAVLMLISGWNGWRNHDLAQQLARARQQEQAVKAKLENLRNAAANRKQDPALQARLAQLRQDVSTRQQVLKILTGKSFGNTESFAGQFTGLARQRIEGLWLTGLHIRAGGTRLDMQGNALKPELVPQYLQRLSQETVFQGTEFESFLMARRKEAPRWIEFSLQSADKAVTP